MIPDTPNVQTPIHVASSSAATWAKRISSGKPRANPSARRTTSMVYAILHGGGRAWGKGRGGGKGGVGGG
ncbi:unnamed protein product [Closterium sp. NIES-53]